MKKKNMKRSFNLSCYKKIRIEKKKMSMAKNAMLYPIVQDKNKMSFKTTG